MSSSAHGICSQAHVLICSSAQLPLRRSCQAHTTAASAALLALCDTLSWPQRAVCPTHAAQGWDGLLVPSCGSLRGAAHLCELRIGCCLARADIEAQDWRSGALVVSSCNIVILWLSRAISAAQARRLDQLLHCVSAHHLLNCSFILSSAHLHICTSAYLYICSSAHELIISWYLLISSCAHLLICSSAQLPLCRSCQAHTTAASAAQLAL